MSNKILRYFLVGAGTFLPFVTFAQGLQVPAITSGGWVTRHDYLGLYLLYVLFFLPFVVADLMALFWLVTCIKLKRSIFYAITTLVVLCLAETLFILTVGPALFSSFYKTIYPLIGDHTWRIGMFLRINEIGHNLLKTWGLQMTF